MSTAVVVRRGRVSLRAERRTLVLVGVLGVVSAALLLLGLCYGAEWVGPADAVAALFGVGENAVVVGEWRAPRTLGGLVFGAALGLAGAIFQNLTRNPLGSPDVIGLDAGAYTGALIAITLLSGTPTQLAVSSVVAAATAAAIVYLLSVETGFSGMRLVVTGIAVNAMLSAVNSWIVLRAELEVAIAAVGWSAGSLNGLDWDDVGWAFAIIAVLAAVLSTRAPAVHQAALGDSLAITSGVGLGRLRLLLVAIGVCATATVTAVAGPIVFIALVAPQIGRRLAGAAGVPLLPAALTGAVLLQAADLAAQMLLAPVALPVGAVTTVLGGGYLAWMLSREGRR